MRINLMIVAMLISVTTFGRAMQVTSTSAQTDPIDSLREAPTNWFHLDPEQDNINGVSAVRTYKELLKSKKSTEIIVAVIDSGIDIDHEDLKDKIWVNSDEIAGNGIDDDNNGYVDDVHGWNFIGGKEGNVEKDTYEITREYGRLLKKFEGMSDEKKEKDGEYAYFQKIEKEYSRTVNEMKSNFERFRGFYEQYFISKKLMEAYIGSEELTMEQVQGVSSPDERVNGAKQMMLYVLENDIDEEGLEKANEYYDVGLNYGYNLSFNPREIIGDDFNNKTERFYGNNDVKGTFNFHGTHVAGIIGANRQNNLGIEGIADNVKIMVIRAVPNGDERDKDVANAIRYAVDNGAKVINMSFGKSYSPSKSIVDEAVSYAEKKNVLLVHAAGNSSKNIDEKDNFPNQKMESGKSASNWLEIGALSWKSGEESVAEFSNYGKNSVDVFAPGVDIFSTAPDQEYEDSSGTSMAAPVTSGVAALLLSYFPELTPIQVRNIIIQTAYKPGKLKVVKPGSKDEVVNFSELSRTGGIVNVYEAVKLAEKAVKNNNKIKAY